LRQPDAFRGISTIIDGGKQRHSKPPRHAAVKVGPGSIGSSQFCITKLLENKVPKIGVASLRGLRRPSCGSRKSSGSMRRIASASRAK
jgi:hypothetical protein